MSLLCQKDLFQLDPDVHYLNGAYMSPQLKSTEEAGIRGILRKNNPYRITQDDFFGSVENIKTTFAGLINATPERIAMIPSASYGLGNAVQNLPKNNGTQALIVGQEFPSDYYALSAWCSENDKSLHVIPMPEHQENRAEIWNQNILDTIQDDTAVIVISSIHWSNGIIFDLKAIGSRCQQTDTRLIVDGTQSVGAMPMDIAACHIDALICAGYKWLMGPYSLGVAYYGPTFDQGRPIEQSWMNRVNAREFSSLTGYTDEYFPASARFNVGEFSNFVLCPMLETSLNQIASWGVDDIMAYSRSLSVTLAEDLRKLGFHTGADPYRAAHLFGAGVPGHLDPLQIMQRLRDQNIIVSVRNGMLRISLHVYNNENDTQALLENLARL